MTTNGERIERALADHDPQVVLVDWFDTVVTRSLSGRTVKEVAARHLVDHFDLACTPAQVLAWRRDAETAVRDRWREAGCDPEHRLEEAAQGMWRALVGSGTGSVPGQDELVAAVVEIELAVERLTQTVDGDVVAALTAATGRRLVVVSDFYFDPDLFRRMIDERGLGSLFHDVFVSCGPRLSKASGRLYPHVLDALAGAGSSCPPDRVLMIGDHPVSDGDRARAHGLLTVAIERPAADRRPAMVARVARATGALAPGLVAADRDRRRRDLVRRALSPVGEACFVELAAALYLFTARLHASARRQGAEPLLFLAREGRFLQVLFQRYQELSPGAAGVTVPNHYLVVSRRSTVLAGMGPLDEEDFQPILDRYPKISLEKLVASLGFPAEEAAAVAAEMGAPADRPVDLGLLRAHPRFRDRYDETRRQQAELLHRYLAQVTGSTRSPLHLVDVGWKGTMQDHLRRAVGPDRVMSGWYLGVVAGADLPDGQLKHGLLFDSREAPTPAFRTLRHFKSMYEYLLQADHGSAAGYRRRPDGTVEPVLDDQADEEATFRRHVAPVQAAVLEAFTRLCRADGLSAEPLLDSPEQVADVHARMLFFPRRAEVELMRSLRHYENFGLMDVVSVGVERPQGRELRRARAALVAHPRRLLAGGWPPLELDALGLPVLIPVVGMYRQLRERTVPGLGRRVRQVRRRP